MGRKKAVEKKNVSTIKVYYTTSNPDEIDVELEKSYINDGYGISKRESFAAAGIEDDTHVVVYTFVKDGDTSK